MISNRHKRREPQENTNKRKETNTREPTQVQILLSSQRRVGTYLILSTYLKTCFNNLKKKVLAD